MMFWDTMLASYRDNKKWWEEHQRMMDSTYPEYIGCSNCGFKVATRIPLGTSVREYESGHPFCELCGCDRG